MLTELWCVCVCVLKDLCYPKARKKKRKQLSYVDRRANLLKALFYTLTYINIRIAKYFVKSKTSQLADENDF